MLGLRRAPLSSLARSLRTQREEKLLLAMRNKAVTHRRIVVRGSEDVNAIGTADTAEEEKEEEESLEMEVIHDISKISQQVRSRCLRALDSCRRLHRQSTC